VLWSAQRRELGRFVCSRGDRVLQARIEQLSLFVQALRAGLWNWYGSDGAVQVANSLSADHDPARKLGYTSVWIDRPDVLGRSRKDADVHQKQFDYQLRFKTLGEFADVVDAVLEKS